MSLETNQPILRYMGSFFVLFTLLGAIPSAGGYYDQRFGKSEPTTAYDLHVEFKQGITKVEVVDANGNTVKNPGPFKLPSTSSGGNSLTFVDGDPGRVKPGEMAPTQKDCKGCKYRFTSTSGKVTLKSWHWTNKKHERIPLVPGDCLPGGRLNARLDVCVPAERRDEHGRE